MSSIFWSLPSWLAQDRVQADWWGLDPVTPPVDEPITIDDVKRQDRIDTSYDDAIIAGYLVAARMAAEKYTNRSLLPQTWDFWLQSWPRDRIMLPRAPLASVAWAKYTDIAEVQRTVDPSIYAVNTSGDPGSIVRRFGQIWPPDPLSPSRPINVRFTAGYPYFSGLLTVADDGWALTTQTGAFDPSWTVNTRIVLNGVTYPIASVQAVDQLKLLTPYSNPGDTDVAWSVNLVPEMIKLAIAMLAAHWYETRVPVMVGRGITSVEITRTVDYLLDPYRINTFGLAQMPARGSEIWP
jgi:uncharacterized phiE125 gp8 family phage protein